jgi:hypothetical protein
VSFHYPAGDYVGELLDSSDIKLPKGSTASRAAAPQPGDVFDVKPGAGQ